MYLLSKRVLSNIRCFGPIKEARPWWECCCILVGSIPTRMHTYTRTLWTPHLTLYSLLFGHEVKSPSLLTRLAGDRCRPLQDYFAKDLVNSIRLVRVGFLDRAIKISQSSSREHQDTPDVLGIQKCCRFHPQVLQGTPFMVYLSHHRIASVLDISRLSIACRSFDYIYSISLLRRHLLSPSVNSTTGT